MAKEARARNQPLLSEEEFAQRRAVLLAGIQQYNDGYFFEAHETWEELWLPSPWPARRFLQGLIQVAAAFVHLMRHEYPGTVGLLDAALAKLQDFPPDYLGIDVAALVEGARRAREEIAALGPERFEEWDQAGIPKITLPGSLKPQ
jgi:predicted metal-dependent hydrolase